MPIDTVAALVDTLRQTQLLEAPQLKEIVRDLQPRFSHPHALAKALLQRNWLTPYQVNQLFQGQGSKLVLGPYVLLERLGEGGMGEVFKARHRKLQRIVAVKLIRKERLNHPSAVQRFVREVKAAARLDHAHIVHAFDADQIGGTYLLVMEYVEGIDLSQLVKQQGRLPVEQSCEYVRQAAEGLQHAHERGLIHRDFKPSNLLLAKKSGTIKILDLGLAHLEEPTGEDPRSTLTESGTILGTPDFIAPEQAKHSGQVDIRADLYSLGCTLYFLLTGQVPHPGATLGEKLLKHMMDEPAPVEQLRPDVPPGVAAIVRKLMAKKPEDRYATPQDLVVALGTGLTTGRWPAPPRRPTASRRLWNTFQKRPRLLWMVAGSLCLLAILPWLSCRAFGPGGGLIGPRATITQPLDPSFATPVVGTERYDAFQYNPRESPWTFSSNSGLAGNGSGFTSSNPQAPEGMQVAFLQGEDSSIRQAIVFAAGTFTVRFQAAQRGNFQPQPQSVQVLIDSTVVGTFTPTSTEYAAFATNSFTVAAGSHTLTFLGRNSGDTTAFLAQVSIQGTTVIARNICGRYEPRTRSCRVATARRPRRHHALDDIG